MLAYEIECPCMKYNSGSGSVRTHVISLRCVAYYEMQSRRTDEYASKMRIDFSAMMTAALGLCESTGATQSSGGH
jgi:hypothetical protein